MMKRGIEFLRGFEATELRAVTQDDDDARKRIEGYAAVFDSETDIGGMFREVVRQGAFKKTLGESDQVALWDHDSSKPLGRRSKKTLELKEDEHGLKVVIYPPENTWGNDAYEAVRRGDVQGFSFGFQVVKEAWNEETQLRELNEVRLFEVSPVTFPAYEATEAEARGIIDERCVPEDDTTEEPDAVHSAAGATPHRITALRNRLALLERE